VNLGEVRNQLQIRGFEGFPPQDLNLYINWGYQDISRVTRWMWEDVDKVLTYTVGDPYKTLATELPTLKKVRSVAVVTPQREFQLKGMDDQEFFRDWGALDLTSSRNRGEPARYHLSGYRLYVLPPVDTPRDVRVYYEQQVVPMVNDGDVPITPEDYDSAILKASEVWCHDRMRQTEYKREAERDLIRLLEDAVAAEQYRTPEVTERMTRPARWA
jgi:hypothetical protein